MLLLSAGPAAHRSGLQACCTRGSDRVPVGSLAPPPRPTAGRWKRLGPTRPGLKKSSAGSTLGKLLYLNRGEHWWAGRSRATGGGEGGGEEEEGEPARSALAGGEGGPPPEEEREEGPLDRFLNPKIDDSFLPISDAVVAGGFTPTAVAFTVLTLGLPVPEWLATGAANSGVVGMRGLPYMVASLSHGFQLAFCWLVGALAGKAYEEKNYKGPDWLATTVKSGAFAVGVLILLTQVSLAFRLGTLPALAPETPDVELATARAAASLTIDIISEATVMLGWRFWRSTMID